MPAQPRRRIRRSPRVIVAAAALSALLTATACGTRVPESSVIKAEQGAIVTLNAGQAAALAGGGTQNGGGALSNGAGGLGTLPTAGATLAAGGGTGTGSAGGGAGSSGGGTSGSGSGAGGSGGGSNASASCTSQGAPLVIGQVTTASGVIGPDVGSAATVSQVWARYINANGGIACHPVQVLTRDDGSDPSKSQSEVNDVVGNGHAQALFADFVPISIAGFQSAVDKASVPVIGGDLFSTVWWSDPNFYPVGTYVSSNAIGSTAAVAKTGHTKVAVLYCIEAAICPPYKDAVVSGAAKNGYQVVYNSQVTITAPDYTSVCQNAKNAGATQISMIVDGSAVSRIARSCLSIGYNVPMAVASLGSTFPKSDANVQKMTVTLASAAAPWFLSNTPALAAFQSAMHTYAPSLPTDPTTIVAWADGMMLKTAIEKLGAAARNGPITTSMIKKGLEMVRNETLGGLVAPTSFSPNNGPNPHNPCYFPATFGSGGVYRSLVNGYQCQQ